MQQIISLMNSLSWKQKAAMVLALAATGLALAALLNWQTESDFRPIFTSLSQEDAAGVVQKLKESGVPFRLSEGGTSIRVPSERVAELRLEMASAGLPRSGRIGFELFDRTNFGTTDFAEQVNFRRAVEGELERSVMSLAEVEMARVHVTMPKDSVFLESRQEAKASVMVRLRPGLTLTPQNVIAITHLVSSAVEGLKPDLVSVLDMKGNLLSRPRRASVGDGVEPSDGMLDFQKKLETDMVRKISSTLEPLLGVDKFRAGVSVECDFTSGEQSEESFDPDRSVMTNSTRTEESLMQTAQASGVPGTASSLPRPSSRPPTSPGGTTRRSETISYQTSRVTRHVKLPQGALKKISASVLLDQVVSWQQTEKGMTRVLTPPSAERMKSIRELVAGAIGIDEERGDSLIVESLPFESTMAIEPPAQSPAHPPAAPPLNPWTKFQQQPWFWYAVGGGSALLLLILAAGGWLLRKRARKSKNSGTPLPPSEVIKALAGPTAESNLPQTEPQRLSSGAPQLLAAGSAEDQTEELILKARQQASESQEVYLNVVRGWLAEDAEA